MQRTIVFLHGWGMTPAIWHGMRICLSPRALLTPALPGHHGRPGAGPTLSAWSDTLAGDLPEQSVLCGWSLGGMIALDIARRHPQKVARLVLVGTSPCFVNRDESAPSGEWRHGLEPEIVEGFVKGFDADPAGTLRRFLALQAIGGTQRRGVIHALTRSLAPSDGSAKSDLAAGLAVLASTDLRVGLEEITQPVHIVHGREDALMPVAAARWLATRITGSRLTEFDGCGHAPFLERPEAFAAQLAEIDLD